MNLGLFKGLIINKGKDQNGPEELNKTEDVAKKVNDNQNYDEIDDADLDEIVDVGEKSEPTEEMVYIEKMEYKYLNKFFHFMKFAEDEMMIGFETKEKIKDDRYGKYGGENGGISDFAVGAERIMYALFNGKGIGQPNSCPVGSDLFFEVSDAFIHIDLKTVQTNNIGDITNSIFVGKNQNSYKGQMLVKGKGLRDYTPALPTFYNKGKENQKICLTYFITILYEADNGNILNINIISMPNGDLEPYYKTRVLKAGKNPDKTRFGFARTPRFELLFGWPSRIKVVYFDENMKNEYKQSLKFFKNLYENQQTNI